MSTSGVRIKAAIRREETTLRLGGMGDNYHMSWAADGRQFVAVCDGLGWLDKPKAFYNSRLFTIAGEPEKAVFQEVVGYPELTGTLKTDQIMRYYGFGTLALEGTVYQFLSTPNHPFVRPDMSPWPQARFVGAKLIYSPDSGRTWHNQDGSTPVIWDRWPDRNQENMAFFEESQNAFSLLSIVQMGRNYSANRDGYVYVYSPNGATEGSMNELVMFRAPKARILDRNAYEYFAGFAESGSARWVRGIEERVVAHRFPRGWVNTSLHPWAWMPSVTYNSPLDLYLMASWGTGCTPNGEWFGKPSYLGFWISKTAWGPWTQIHEESVWMPQDDADARAFAPQVAPKWIALDGKSFWLVWSDFQFKCAESEIEKLGQQAKTMDTSPETMVGYFQKVRTLQPYYAFNTQRVDLIC